MEGEKRKEREEKREKKEKRRTKKEERKSFLFHFSFFVLRYSFFPPLPYPSNTSTLPNHAPPPTAAAALPLPD
ncbi:hypothetical protein, partial [Thermoleptolyngbya sp.]